MAFQQLIAPGTGAVSVSSATEFDGTTYNSVLFAADNLATSETAIIYVKVNGSYKPAANTAGAAAQLSATVCSIQVPGGSIYAVSKAATAGACGVYGTGINSH